MSLHKVLAAGTPLNPPGWITEGLCYEALAPGGMVDSSDMEVYGICIPPRDMVFPHMAGEISGFGKQLKRFDVWQPHRVTALDKTWDFQIFGIVKFFQLAMDNTPNAVGALFVPFAQVLSSTAVGEYIRDCRGDFLHKGAWPKFRSAASVCLSKIRPKPAGKRPDLGEPQSHDTRIASQAVRLLLEAEQILISGNIDPARDTEQLKAIWQGDWTLEQLERWAQDKESSLEGLCRDSTLPDAPDETVLKRHLLHCLEIHYGDLSSVVASSDTATQLLKQIAALTRKYR